MLGARLLAEHAVALRPRPGDRHRRRRCDRGGGERRAAHRAGAVADRGDAQGDGGSVGADHRDRAGAVRGVRADGVHQRPDRAVLPAVRADHRDLHGDLGLQLADAEPGAGLAAAAAARRAARSRAARGRPRCSAGSSAGSTASSPARPTPTRTAWRALLRVGARRARALRRPDRADASLGFARVPQGFVPTQDKDYLVAFAQLPDASTLDRTEAVIRADVGDRARAPGVSRAPSRFPGLSINGFVNASNAGIVFVIAEAGRGARGRAADAPARSCRR